MAQLAEVPPLSEFEIIPPATREVFTVTDDASAEWAMRKWAGIQRKKVQNKAIVDAEIERVTSWLKATDESLDGDAQYFENVLKPYALKVRIDSKDKIKSISLPSGTIKTTSGRVKVEVTDETAFIAWAKNQENLFLRIKTEIDKTALNKAVIETKDSAITPNGEIVPFVEVTTSETTVSFVVAD